jgi:hypothetical protein
MPYVLSDRGRKQIRGRDATLPVFSPYFRFGPLPLEIARPRLIR